MSEVNLDIQEINLDGDLNNTSKEISLDTAASSVDLKEANFGSGIELLMNEKVKNNSKSPSSNSLKDLENDLNMVDNNVLNDKEINIQNNTSSQNSAPTIEIAKSTVELNTNSSSWDGFKDINSNHIEVEGKKAAN